MKTLTTRTYLAALSLAHRLKGLSPPNLDDLMKSSALLILFFVFQGAALELSQGAAPHHQPQLNHRRNFTFRLPNSPEIEYADEQQLYSLSGESGGLVDISYLEAMREQLPSLAGFPDSFILRTPMQTLLKMESNAMKRSSINRARNVEDKLMFNMDLISSSKLEVKAGQDDRN
jgi:hypothetical protein